MPITIALAGNPNCGKTTFFNALTGSKGKVGNWPGVTLEQKTAQIKHKNEQLQIIDLPGIYSFFPVTESEFIARDYLLTQRPDVVLNIIDTTNLERSLYLTTQLIELDIPVILALNMMDEFEQSGDKIDICGLADFTALKIFPIVAKTKKGFAPILDAILEASQQEPVFKNIYEDTELFPYIQQIKSLLFRTGMQDILFRTIKIMEDESTTMSELYLAPTLKKELQVEIDSLNKICNNDINGAVSSLRYKFAKECQETYITKAGNKSKLTASTEKWDRVFLHRVWGIPIFLLIMFLVFQITFGAFGSLMTDLIDGLINGSFADFVREVMLGGGVSDFTTRLVVDGIIIGVGTVLTFVPQVLLLFLFLSFLGDVGYMARAAFIMDKFLAKFGLSGHGFIPMIMGFGCSVPSIMAVRGIESRDERRLTALVVPFMSCSARLPVYAVFIGAFFPHRGGLVMFSIYLLGIIVAIFSAGIISKFFLKGERGAFMMELPPYRMPLLSGVIKQMLIKCGEFLKRAGTIMFLASVIIWFFQTFNMLFQVVEDSSDSMFAAIGTLAAPLFEPLGYGTWQASVALLTGVIAKEAVVSTLAILYGVGEESLTQALAGVFTPLTAYAYVVFVALYMPCVSALAALMREMNSIKWTLFAIAYQTGIAWIIAFAIYRVGLLIGFQ